MWSESDTLNSLAEMANVVNAQKRSVRTMYLGLVLALVSLVGVFATGGVLIFLLPSMLIYFMWGMNSRIKELEARLARQQPAATSQS